MKRTVAMGVLAMPFVLSLATWVLSDSDVIPAPAPSPQDQQLAAEYLTTIQPLLKTYCYDCHAGDEPVADLALDTYKSAAEVSAALESWEKVIDYIRTQQMPPEDLPQPSQAERNQIVQWARRQLYNYDPHNPDPGRVTMRRLNRAEYNNTIRDLIGVDFDPADDFPHDDTGYGFDTIGDVLSLPPMLMEKYLEAAETVFDQAIVTDAGGSQFVSYPAGHPGLSWNRFDEVDGWIALASYHENDVAVPIRLIADGEYLFRVLAYALPEGGLAAYERRDEPQTDMSRVSDRPMTLSLMLGDTIVKDVEVTTDADHPQWYEVRVPASAGEQVFRAAVLRERGPDADRLITDNRPGKEQPGLVFVRQVEIKGPLPGALHRADGGEMVLSNQARRQGDRTALGTSGDAAEMTIDLPRAGEVIIRAVAAASIGGDELPRLRISVDGTTIEEFDVTARAGLHAGTDYPGLSTWLGRARPRLYEVRSRLTAGRHTVTATFLNDFFDPEQTDPNRRDRNVFLERLEVFDPASPVVPPPLPGPLRDLFVEHAGDEAAVPDPAFPHNRKAAEQIVSDFGRRAWRRPILPGELRRLMTLYDLAKSEGDSFHGAVKLVMKGMLVSPNFIFRDEIQPRPNSHATRSAINEFDLASRLSYFIWSSTPDDELLDLAERNELRNNLEAQVMRMLASPKSRALVDNFASQWLGFRSIDSVNPDRQMFPEFDWGLREAMQAETATFIENLISEDRSLMDLLTADYTFVNERLARHYGIPDVRGDEFQRVSLKDLPRRGVLTHGSMLLITSNPTRTSPVKRGKWVLENLLASAPPPPPPDIPSLKEEKGRLLGSIREQLEKHRADPTCASCHVVMDPVGFSLENFDVTGRWRETYGEDPIDASGELPSGDTFTGPVELSELLARTREDDFLACVVEKTMTYAIGRGMEPYDRPTIDQIVSDLKEHDSRFSVLVINIVNSVPFQKRRGEAPEPAEPVTQARSD